MQHYLRWVCAGQAAQGVGTWFVLCWKCTFGRQLQEARPLTPPHSHFAALPLRYKYGNVTGSTANAATGALTLTVPTEMTGGCNESVGCYTASCGVSSCVHLQHPFAHPKRRLLTLARCDAGFAIQPPAGPSRLLCVRHAPGWPTLCRWQCINLGMGSAGDKTGHKLDSPGRDSDGTAGHAFHGNWFQHDHQLVQCR